MQIKRTLNITKGVNVTILSVIALLSLSIIYRSYKLFIPQNTKNMASTVISNAFNKMSKQLLVSSVPLVDYIYNTDEMDLYDVYEYKNSYYNKLFSMNFPLVDYVMQYESKEYKTAVEIYPELTGKDSIIIEEGLEALRELPEEFVTEAATTTVEVYQPKTYTLEQLTNFNFLLNNFYIIDKSIRVARDDFPLDYFLNKNLKVNLTDSKPKVLIYHTHSQESFTDSRSGVEDDTIVGVGTELARILKEEYGINVIHNTGKYDFINGKLDRSKAYYYAEKPIQKILEENPSIEVVIDLHRDGVKQHLVTNIDGRPTAKIMFFNGICKTLKNGKMVSITSLPNKYIKDNMAFSFQLQLKAAELYPTLTRKIYLKNYRYNLHMLPKSLLIEVGSEMNSVAEAKNAMIPLAKMLHEVIK